MEPNPSNLLSVKAVTASSYSANFKPGFILTDTPEDTLNRWTAENHHRAQWLKIELTSLSIVKTITFGKYIAEHPCNIQHFQVFGAVEDSDEMILLLESTLKNDNVAQTFALKHSSEDDVTFPCRFIKIVPVRPYNQTFNVSIWYVALRGVDSPYIVNKTLEDYSTFREKTAMRLILKHLQTRAPRAFQTLLAETTIEVEHPLIRELDIAFVDKADFDKSEDLLARCAQDRLFNLKLSNASARPGTIWKRLFSPPAPFSFASSSSAPTNSTNTVAPSPIHFHFDSYADPSTYPARRGGHMSVFDPLEGRMFVFGGWDGLKDSAELWMWECYKESWSCISRDTSAAPPSLVPPFSENRPAPPPVATLPPVDRYGDLLDDNFSDPDVEDLEPFYGERDGVSWAVRGQHANTQTLRLGRIAASGATGPDARSCGSAIFDESTGDIYIIGRYLPRESGYSPTFGELDLTALRNESVIPMRDEANAAGATGSGRGAGGEAGPTDLDDPVTRFRRIRRAVAGGDDVDSPQLEDLPDQSWARSIRSGHGGKSDFWRYHTRGPSAGKWEMLSADTKADGGPNLVHDLAMTFDSERRTIYVFGGEAHSWRGRANHPSYGGFFSYDIDTCVWKMIFGDPRSGRPGTGYITGRSCHSMAFDPKTQRVYVIGGERFGKMLDEVWTYEVSTGRVSMMAFPAGARGPSAEETMKATFNPETREIFLLPELVTTSASRAQHPNHRTESDDKATSMLTTLWIYSVDENTWASVTEPFRGSPTIPAETGDPSSSSDPPSDASSPSDDSVPKPRIGYSLVYDPQRQQFLAFGGNAGGKRMNDVWSLRLNRPSVQDFIRRGKLQIRTEKFKHLCETAPSLVALQYLQSSLSEAVNHNDEEESSTFRKLLTILLTRPDSPISTRPLQSPVAVPASSSTSTTRPASPHPTDITAPYPSSPSKSAFGGIGDESFEVELSLRAGGDDGEDAMDTSSPMSPQHSTSLTYTPTQVHTSRPPLNTSRSRTAPLPRPRAMTEAEKKLQEGRRVAFDHILTFIDPRAKRPSLDLLDMIRAEV